MIPNKRGPSDLELKLVYYYQYYNESQTKLVSETSSSTVKSRCRYASLYIPHKVLDSFIYTTNIISSQ